MSFRVHHVYDCFTEKVGPAHVRFCVLIQVSKGNDGSHDASPLRHGAHQYLADHPDLLFAPRSAYQEMLKVTSLASMPSAVCLKASSVLSWQTYRC